MYHDLIAIVGYGLPVYASPGTEGRAQAISVRCANAHRFLRAALGADAAARVLVLAPQHWQRFTGSPMFGVPQTVDVQTVVVAGEDAGLWTLIVPPPGALPPAAAQALRRVYGRSDGVIAIGTFMDLLAVHELGHVFIDQTAGAFDFHRPRRWLVELFCNLGLHAYVAAVEPAQMEHLTTFPRAMIALGHTHLPHRQLADFERLYADMEPSNFVWYLSQLHLAAHHIYDAGGLETVQALFRAIVQSQNDVSDEQLAVQLRDAVHPIVAQVLTTWPDLELSEHRARGIA
jgi:hypothetical protein